MTGDEAQTLVWQHWEYVCRLARQRFPRDDNLAHEAAHWVIDALEADGWRRVRTWQGTGDFLPFVATLTSRLLTDFFRARFGYIRKPAWLEDKTDPFWHAAYQLLIVERWGRHEAIDQLMLRRPPRERWYVEEVVGTILAKCRKHARPPELQDDYDLEQIPANEEPSHPSEVSAKEMLEALVNLLHGDNGAAISPRIAEIATRLRPHLDLNDEDCMLLKLYYLEQMPVETIKRLLHLEGDLYKRIKKVLAHVRKGFEKAGLDIALD